MSMTVEPSLKVLQTVIVSLGLDPHQRMHLMDRKASEGPLGGPTQTEVGLCDPGLRVEQLDHVCLFHQAVPRPSDLRRLQDPFEVVDVDAVRVDRDLGHGPDDVGALCAALVHLDRAKVDGPDPVGRSFPRLAFAVDQPAAGGEGRRRRGRRKDGRLDGLPLLRVPRRQEGFEVGQRLVERGLVALVGPAEASTEQQPLMSHASSSSMRPCKTTHFSKLPSIVAQLLELRLDPRGDDRQRRPVICLDPDVHPCPLL